MRVSIVAKHKKDASAFRNELRSDGIHVVSKSPELVLTIGGDGTFLEAERKYPGIPKLLIRDRSICAKCNIGRMKSIATLIKYGNYSIREYRKLEATVRRDGRYMKKLAANDIVVRNKQPYAALRFSLEVSREDKVQKFSCIIGDGIVVATSFGSTGYFYSITRRSFDRGIGIAFNNATEPIEHMILPDAEGASVRLTVIRNEAVVSADNDKKTITLKEGEKIRIRQSKETFKIVHLEG